MVLCACGCEMWKATDSRGCCRNGWSAIFSSFSSRKHDLARRMKGSATSHRRAETVQGTECVPLTLTLFIIVTSWATVRDMSFPSTLSLTRVRESMCERGAECGRPLSLSRSPASSWAGTTGPQASNQATSDLIPAWERVLFVLLCVE